MLNNRDIVNILLNKSVKEEDKLQKAESVIQSSFLFDESNKQNLKEQLRNFNKNVKIKWLKCQRKREKFLATYKTWLDSKFQLPSKFHSSAQFQEKQSEQTKIGAGRKSLPFTECTSGTKKNKVLDLSKKYTIEELSGALQKALKNEGKTEMAAAVKEAMMMPSKTVGASEALEMIVNAKLTTGQYLQIRNYCTLFGVLHLPSYKSVLGEKKTRYFPDRVKRITDISAEVELQFLLDDTVKRIILTIGDAIDEYNGK